jgi:hypothetical protein
MKKVLSIIIGLLIILVLFSMVPSKTFDEMSKFSTDRDYSTIVPAKPPAKPPTRL